MATFYCPAVCSGQLAVQLGRAQDYTTLAARTYTGLIPVGITERVADNAVYVCQSAPRWHRAFAVALAFWVHTVMHHDDTQVWDRLGHNPGGTYHKPFWACYLQFVPLGNGELHQDLADAVRRRRPLPRPDPHQDSPVVLVLDPADPNLGRLRELGYEVFTSAESLHGYVLLRNQEAAGPVPNRRNLRWRRTTLPEISKRLGLQSRAESRLERVSGAVRDLSAWYPVFTAPPCAEGQAG